jgi:hypothetical protein
MTEPTPDTGNKELAELFSELTDGGVVTIQQRERASKAVIYTTGGESDPGSTGAIVDPSANPLEDAIGDPESK